MVLANSSSNSLALRIFGSSKLFHRVSLLKKKEIISLNYTWMRKGSMIPGDGAIVLMSSLM